MKNDNVYATQEQVNARLNERTPKKRKKARKLYDPKKFVFTPEFVPNPKRM